MHIFVDESGNFVPPPRNRPHMCCVATLAVPDSRLDDLETLHARLLADWNPSSGELKGRNLTERNFQRILTALAGLDVVPTIVAIDMMLQSEDVTTAHRMGQAARLRESVVGAEFLPSFRQSAYELAVRLETLSNQLYVQSSIQTKAIARALRVSPMHYAQTEPSTLGSFVWRIDAKDRTIQECEKLWSDLLKPMLQTVFVDEPMLFVRDKRFDYSAMDRLQGPDFETPAHILAARPNLGGGPRVASDLRPLVKDLAFEDSKACPGIQFADVIASAFCRACNGRLKPRGWERLGGLLVRHPKDRQAVSYWSMGPLPAPMRPTRMSYGEVVRQVEAQARDFVVADGPGE
jgi:uncharacterized protein DUF3800